MQKLNKTEKEFLAEVLDEYINEAKDVEQRDSNLTQNLARFVYDESKVKFLKDLKKKISEL
ncbi:MAG: hypothetical protein ACOCQG_06230 [Candidatus Nanoarchaeia archaeon]